MMKKGWAAVFAASMLAFVLVSTPAVSAAEDEPLQGVMDAAFDLSNYPACTEDDSCFWVGTVSGDLVGGIEIHELWDQNYVVGKPGAPLGIEHFFETFRIDLDSGGWVSGVDAGVWNQETGKFRANGWVMYASGGLEDLIGYKLHESGMVAFEAPGFTLSAEWFLAAP